MRTKNFIYVLAACAMILSFTNVNAKGGENGRFSVGAELALPMGTFGDNAGTGFGGSLRYEMPSGDNLGLMATVGYLTFGGKTISTGFGDYKYTNSMVPIMLGAKYYFTEQQNGFYGMVQIGVTMFSAKVESPAYTYFGITVPAQSATASSTDLSYAPGVGYHLDNLDFGVSYDIVSTTGSSSSYVGLRVAYVFGEK